MADQLERADAALVKAEPYVLTGCDLTAADTGADCAELVAAYDALLHDLKDAKMCLRVPASLVRTTQRLRSVLPAD